MHSMPNPNKLRACLQPFRRSSNRIDIGAGATHKRRSSDSDCNGTAATAAMTAAAAAKTTQQQPQAPQASNQAALKRQKNSNSGESDAANDGDDSQLDSPPEMAL